MCLPTDYLTLASNDYFVESLGELSSFIEANSCDIIIAGDFNVDFAHHNSNHRLLLSLMDYFNLCSVDHTSSFSSSLAVQLPMKEMMVMLGHGLIIF